MVVSSASTSSATRRRRLPFVVLGIITLMVAGAVTVRWYWSTPRLNVILVTFDTTRADRLGAYGYQQGLTSGFDNFAKQGVVFDRAYAPAPLTLPSHATMLTGLYPPEHGLRVNGAGRLDSQIPLLPEILKEKGYETGAFIAAAVLDSQYGLDRGFDTYDDDLPRKKLGNHFGEPRRDGREIIDAALSWLGQRTSQPFFCWIHLYDAHGPYDSRPDEFGQRFEDQPYDAGVAWQVQQFERLTAYLKDRKLDAKTLMIVAGDHGEGLDEHMESEHGMLVYNTTLHVPFVFAGPPECRPGTHVPNAVSLVDLTPTVLDILRIPQPKHISGRSLYAALKGQAIEHRDCYGETETPFVYNYWSPLQTVISTRWKYIHTTRPELYDLETDFGERTNLAESAKEELQQMRKALEQIQATFVPAAAQNLKLSEKDLEKLKALGYISGGNVHGDDRALIDTETLTDVKDMLPMLAKFDRARHLSMEGELDESISLLQEIAQATTEFPAAGILLGECLAQSGQIDEAIAAYRSVLARRPDFVGVRFSLGKILSRQGRFEEAEAEFREALKDNPDSATYHYELAQVLANLQRFKEAVTEYREAIRLEPSFAAANIALGQLLATLQRPAEAKACFEQAIEHDPDAGVAHEFLMILFAQAGQSDKAIAHGRKAVALEPNSFSSRFNLGVLLVAQRLYAEGLSELREAHKLSPDDPRVLPQIQHAEDALKKPAR